MNVINKNKSRTLKRQVLDGVAWTGGAAFFGMLFQLAVSVGLARLLTPRDFGLYAIVFVVIELMSHFIFNIQSVVIQRKELSEAHVTAAFYLALLAGFIAFIVVYFGSPALESFFRVDGMRIFLWIAATQLLLCPFYIIPFALLQREMDFKSVNFIALAACCFGGCVSLVMGFLGFGIWSLIANPLCATFAKIILLSRLYPRRLKDRLRWHALRDHLWFYFYSVGNSVVYQVRLLIDQLVIGRLLAMSTLGIYQIARTWALLPQNRIIPEFLSVVFPVFSIIQDEEKQLRDGRIKLTAYVALLFFPLLIGLGLVAPDFILVIYGSKWLPAAFLIRVMVVTGLFGSLSVLNKPLFLAKGRPDLSFKLSAVSIPLFLIFMVPAGMRWEIFGVVTGFSLATTIMVWVEIDMANRMIHLPIQDYCHSLLPAASGSFAMIVSVIGWRLFAAHWFLRPDIFGSWAMLTSSIAVGVVSYGCFFSILRFERVEELKDIFGKVFSLLRSANRVEVPLRLGSSDSAQGPLDARPVLTCERKDAV